MNLFCGRVPGPYPGQSEVGDGVGTVAGGRINHPFVVGQNHGAPICREYFHRFSVGVIGAIGIPALDLKVIREAEGELLGEGVGGWIRKKSNGCAWRVSINLRSMLKMLSIEKALKLGKPSFAPMIHGMP